MVNVNVACFGRISLEVNLIDAILIKDFEKVRIDAIIAIVYRRQGFSRKCRSCGSDVVRGFNDNQYSIS